VHEPEEEQKLEEGQFAVERQEGPHVVAGEEDEVRWMGQ
jgi:hypothetical protein